MGKTKLPKGKGGKKPKGANGFVPMSPYDVLTLSQAAAYLQLPEAEVRVEAEGGRLSGRAVADGWRFTRDELLKWVRTPRPSRPEVASPGFHETEEEYQAYWASILAFRDEVDRLHKRGKYAEEE